MTDRIHQDSPFGAITVLETDSKRFNIFGTADGEFVLQGNVTRDQLVALVATSLVALYDQDEDAVAALLHVFGAGWLKPSERESFAPVDKALHAILVVKKTEPEPAS